MSVEPGGVESRLRQQTSCRDSSCHRLLILHSLLGNRATGLCSCPWGPERVAQAGWGSCVRGLGFLPAPPALPRTRGLVALGLGPSVPAARGAALLAASSRCSRETGVTSRTQQTCPPVVL